MDYNTYFHIGDSESTLRTIHAANTPINKQISKTRSQSWTWMKGMFGGEYNHDQLNYQDYDKMLRDPQINFANQLVKLALISKKLIWTPATENPQDVEICSFVEECFQNMDVPLRQVRKDMDTARVYGYAVSEVIYKLREDGKIGLKDIIPLDISTLPDCFNYEKNIVIQTPLGENPVEIPMEKCMINTFDETFRNKYGRSQLKPLYDTSFMKSHSLKWLAIFLEKHEGPTLVGIQGENSDAQEMQANIDSIHDGTAGFVGRPGEVYEVLESSHRGESFNTAIQYYDHMIAITFMIGALVVGQASSQGGSLAQSQTHLDVFGMAADGILEDHTIPFQEQTKRLVDYNFTTDKYPKCHFEPFTQKDLVTLLNALQPYAQSFVLTVDELGLNHLVPEILKQYADIELDPQEREREEPNPEPISPEQITPEPDQPEINMKAGRPGANYIKQATDRVKRGGRLY